MRHDEAMRHEIDGYSNQKEFSEMFSVFSVITAYQNLGKITK
jgi:hypothetical protein